MSTRIVFVTKQNCGLCDSGLEHVTRGAAWLRLDLDVVDMASDPERYNRYGERLPVVLDTHGAPIVEGGFGFGEALAAMVKVRFRA